MQESWSVIWLQSEFFSSPAAYLQFFCGFEKFIMLRTTWLNICVVKNEQMLMEEKGLVTKYLVPTFLLTYHIFMINYGDN